MHNLIPCKFYKDQINSNQEKRKDHFGLNYVDTPVQYADIFQGCKNDYVQLIFLIFIVFAQNICCVYMLGSLRRF